MEFVLESNNMADYVKSDKYMDFFSESIQRKADELFASLSDDTEKIKAAYEFVRDEIYHSGDIDSEKVTKSASETLEYQEGICIAKSLLLAALLRYGGIPTGLCYQRLTKYDTPDMGYIIHGLNAVYLSTEKKWIRLDARGNKQNVDAQFSMSEEKIAFPARGEYHEIDFPIIYAKPHPLVMEAFERCKKRDEYDFDSPHLSLQD
ncbi:MAG: transglutaminase family protein [Methanomicrobiales archaeon]|jgi:transglutaminase-like putative cysteine protease|nr:transglutaminase family protein [Methanomicrobiales archaeon]